MFPLKSDLLVQISTLRNVATQQKITGATVTMSIFEEAALNLNVGPVVKAVQKVTPSSPVVNTFTAGYTLGGAGAAHEILAGEEIVGATSGATALVKTVTLTSGSWSAGTAAGALVITDQIGTFQAELLKIGSDVNVATVAADTDNGGSFTLSFDGSTTSSIDGNATLAAIKSALEALGNVDNVNVTGDPLDTDPVSNGFYVEWASANPEEDGNVPLLTISIVSLSGPASVTIGEQTRGHLIGAARDAGAGKVGLPIEAHGQIAADYIHIIGSANYDGEEAVVSVSRDEIVITATYAAEVFTGKEEVYIGIQGTGLPGISLSDDGGGDYSAYLPDDLERYTRGKRCILLVTLDKAGLDLLIAKTSPTGFYKG